MTLQHFNLGPNGTHIQILPKIIHSTRPDSERLFMLCSFQEKKCCSITKATCQLCLQISDCKSFNSTVTSVKKSPSKLDKIHSWLDVISTFGTLEPKYSHCFLLFCQSPPWYTPYKTCLWSHMLFFFNSIFKFPLTVFVCQADYSENGWFLQSSFWLYHFPELFVWLF